jgi:hypothetical protein
MAYYYNIMRECDEGIWFEEEDPDSEFYNPKCCRNVYIDLILGNFDYLDNQNHEEEYYIDEEEYYADNEFDYIDEEEYYTYNEFDINTF